MHVCKLRGVYYPVSTPSKLHSAALFERGRQDCTYTPALCGPSLCAIPYLKLMHSPLGVVQARNNATHSSVTS